MPGVPAVVVGEAVASPEGFVLEEPNPPQAAITTNAAAIAAIAAAMVRESTSSGYGLTALLSLISFRARRWRAGNSASIPSAIRAVITTSCHCSNTAGSVRSTRL